MAEKGLPQATTAGLNPGQAKDLAFSHMKMSNWAKSPDKMLNHYINSCKRACTPLILIKSN